MTQMCHIYIYAVNTLYLHKVCSHCVLFIRMEDFSVAECCTTDALLNVQLNSAVPLLLHAVISMAIYGLH